MTNSYLADANIPPRPRGFAWYLKDVPGREMGDLWRAINSRVTSLDPADVRAVVKTVLDEFYHARG